MVTYKDLLWSKGDGTNFKGNTQSTSRAPQGGTGGTRVRDQDNR